MPMAKGGGSLIVPGKPIEECHMTIRTRSFPRWPRRRGGWLGVACALVAAVVLGSPVARAAGIYDNMVYLAKHLPPGILHCRDRAIRTLYAQEVEGLWSDFDGCIVYRMRSDYGGCFFDNVIVSLSSRKLEPALYLLREQSNRRRDSDLEWPKVTDVPQMAAFDDGIRYFYLAYVYGRGNEKTRRLAESNFLHSISYAAYDDRGTAERKAKEYLEAGLEGKKRVVMDMRARFEAMGNGDRNSRHPRDPYNRKLVASWSSFYLVRYYDNLEKKKGERGNLIYDHLEIEFRPRFRVRGPPHYKD